MLKSRQREIGANISNFLDAQFACAPMLLPPPPPLTTAGHLPAVVSPRGGALANFVRPRDRAFENPGATPDLLALTCRWRFFFRYVFSILCLHFSSAYQTKSRELST